MAFEEVEKEPEEGGFRRYCFAHWLFTALLFNIRSGSR